MQNTKGKGELVLPELIEMTSDAVVIAADGILTEINDAACQLLGWSRAAFLGQPLADLISLEDNSSLCDAPATVALQMQIGKVRCQNNHFVAVKVRARRLPDQRCIAFLRPLAEPTPIPDLPQAAPLLPIAAALHHQEQQFQQLSDSLPQMVWITDATGWLEYVNQQWSDYSGFTLEQSRDPAVIEQYHHPDDRQQVLHHWAIALATRQPFEVEGRLKRSDGVYRWFLMRAVPAFDAQGQILRWYGISTDITDRQQAEAALQERNQHIQILYETTRDLLSTEQPLALVETVFAKLKPLIGLDIYFNYVLDEFRQQLHLEFHSGISADTARAIEWLELGQAVCGTVAQRRCQIVQPNLQQSTDPQTELVRSLGLTAYSCQPLVAQGKLFGTLGFGSRSRSHFTLAETNLFQAICDQIAIALERSALLFSLQQQTEELQRVNRLKDDFFSTLSHELRTPLNPILGWTQMLKGGRLTPEKSAQALETIERNTRQMVGLVSDLLDVGRVIRGRFQLDSRPIDLTLTLTAAIETVQFAAQAKAITIDYHPTEIIYTQGDGDRLQQIFWNLLSNAIKFTPAGGRVEVRVEQVEGSGRVGEWMGRRVDKQELERVDEWVSGRVGFCREPQPNGEQASQAVNEPAAIPSPHPLLNPPLYAQITITDTGIGIPADFLPFVFDHFRQAESGSTRSYGGLGLGLAIVRHLVELHGGMIQAASSGQGQGATFTVQLPLLPAHATLANRAIDRVEPSAAGDFLSPSLSAPAVSPAVSPAASRDGRAAGLRSLRVLVLDDEPDNLALVRFLLEQEGLTVLALTSPLAALDAIAQSPPDLLISDIGMPEMDGYELIRRVRTMPVCQDKPIPAIALTAFAQPEDRKRAIESGFQAFIAKPIDPLQLIKAVAQFVS